jgi:hypothetical protein
MRNHPDCVAALVLAGCDVGITTVDGLTGRQRAEQLGHTAVVCESSERRASELVSSDACPRPATGGAAARSGVGAAGRWRGCSRRPEEVEEEEARGPV